MHPVVTAERDLCDPGVLASLEEEYDALGREEALVEERLRAILSDRLPSLDARTQRLQQKWYTHTRAHVRRLNPRSV